MTETAAAPSTSLVGARFSRDELTAVVEEAMVTHHVPGVAVGVLFGGQELAAGFGVTNVEHPLPVTPDTLFQIGSITKTMTATALVRLVEAGRLDLDAPVRAAIPDFRVASEAAAARVTLRHLLTHTPGWAGDLFLDTGRGDDAVAVYVRRMAELPQLTPPGHVWAYNNAGFVLAGRIIEVATGATYEAAVRDLVLAPLGMVHSFLFPEDVVTHRCVAGHVVQHDAPRVARPWAARRSGHPAGGVVSCVTDLLRYARFWLGDGVGPDGARLLAAEHTALMRSPQVEAGGFADAVGLSWLLKDVGGVRTVTHGGTMWGQMAALTVAPERGFAVVSLANANQGRALNNAVTAWALRACLGAVEAVPATLTVPAGALEDYGGRYAAPELGELQFSDVAVAAADGGLELRLLLKEPPAALDPRPVAPPPMRAGLTAPDRAVLLDGNSRGERLEFLRSGDGAIEWLRYHGRLLRRLT